MWRTAPALALLLTTSFAQAQDDGTLVGQRVVIKYKQPLRFGQVTVEPKDYRAYTVKSTDGNWLLLVSGGISGWIRSDDIVPLDEAPRFYSDEIARDPSSWNAYLYRGFVWDVKHDYDKAIADYSEAIRIYPGWANTYNNRGWTWHRKKEYDKAIADYNAALRIEPKCVRALVNRGFAWQDKRDYYRALTDFREAIKIDPKYARAVVAQAWLFATCPDKKFRDGNLAIESATRACDLSAWQEADKLAVLAAAYAEAGDFEKAIRWQAKANIRFLDAEDRKNGEERIELYKGKKPFRFVETPIPASQHELLPGHPEESRRWSQFPDPELASRIFAELVERLGTRPDDTSSEARNAWERKLNSAEAAISRKHHLKPSEVKAIWRAGTAAKPSDP
jgi:tetratricopeptide (TPR) repeat protein